MSIEKISPEFIKDITKNVISDMSEHDKDEMAIPSYLHKNPLIPWLMWKRYETISNLLNDCGENNVLEFGCGLGLFLKELSSKFNNVYAVDLFPQFASALSEKLKLKITFLDKINDVEEGHLDVIVAADVLEHIEELDDVLSTFRLKLNKTGKLIVSGPTESIFYKAGRILAGFGDKGDYHHTNIDLLIEDITNNGFKLKKSKRLPFFFLPCLFKICLFEKN